MGEINVEPTDEIKVWFGLEESCEPILTIGELNQLNEHVKKQNELPELPGKHKDGAHIHPSV